MAVSGRSSVDVLFLLDSANARILGARFFFFAPFVKAKFYDGCLKFQGRAVGNVSRAQKRDLSTKRPPQGRAPQGRRFAKRTNRRLACGYASECFSCLLLSRARAGGHAGGHEGGRRAGGRARAGGCAGARLAFSVVLVGWGEAKNLGVTHTAQHNTITVLGFPSGTIR